MEEDILYHFSLSTRSHNLPEMFGDIKVCEIPVQGVVARRGRIQPSPLLLPPVCLCRWQRQPHEGLRPVHPPGADAAREPGGRPRHLRRNRPLLHVQSGAGPVHQCKWSPRRWASSHPHRHTLTPVSPTARHGRPLHLHHAARAHQTAAPRPVPGCGSVPPRNIRRSR